MSPADSDDGNRATPGVVVDVLLPVAVDTPIPTASRATLRLRPGDFVAAPLGTRASTGVVWAVREGGGGNLKSITAKRDWPPLRPAMRDFIDWVARWTLAPRGMVLRMATRGPEAAAAPAAKFAVQPRGKPPSRLTPARERVLAALAIQSPQTRAALAAAAQCGVGVIDGLVDDGALELVALDPEPAAPPLDPDFASLPLSPDQRAAAEALERAVRTRAARDDPARRRHRLGQDRSLFRGDRRGLARRAAGAGPAAGDRADLAVPRPLRRPLRRAAGRVALGDHARASASGCGARWRAARRASSSARARRCSCPSPISA